MLLKELIQHFKAFFVGGAADKSEPGTPAPPPRAMRRSQGALACAVHRCSHPSAHSVLPSTPLTPLPRVRAAGPSSSRWSRASRASRSRATPRWRSSRTPPSPATTSTEPTWPSSRVGVRRRAGLRCLALWLLVLCEPGAAPRGRSRRLWTLDLSVRCGVCACLSCVGTMVGTRGRCPGGAARPASRTCAHIRARPAAARPCVCDARTRTVAWTRASAASGRRRPRRASAVVSPVVCGHSPLRIGPRVFLFGAGLRAVPGPRGRCAVVPRPAPCRAPRGRAEAGGGWSARRPRRTYSTSVLRSFRSVRGPVVEA